MKQLKNHFKNIRTLVFKDDMVERKWLLKSIKGNRNILLLGSIIQVFTDLVHFGKVLYMQADKSYDPNLISMICRWVASTLMVVSYSCLFKLKYPNKEEDDLEQSPAKKKEGDDQRS